MRGIAAVRAGGIASPDGERAGDALERFANERNVSRCRRADTPDLVSAIEVMGTSRVMFSGGFPPRKKSVIHSWAVFCSVVPQLTRATLE